MAARTMSKVTPKYKTSTRRGWRKLHLGVDAEGFIVASQLTENGVDAASQVVNLRDQVEQEVATFTADGACDQLIGDECGRFSSRSRFMHQRRLVGGSGLCTRQGVGGRICSVKSTIPSSPGS